MQVRIGTSLLFSTLALVATILAMSSSARAQAFPPGSYSDTCFRAHWEGSTLVADCEKSDRIGSAISRLPDANSCPGDIWNNDGQIQCRSREDTERLASCEVLLQRAQALALQLTGTYEAKQRERLQTRGLSIAASGRELKCPGFAQCINEKGWEIDCPPSKSDGGKSPDQK
jgi:hypothetical protein